MTPRFRFGFAIVVVLAVSIVLLKMLNQSPAERPADLAKRITETGSDGMKTVRVQSRDTHRPIKIAHMPTTHSASQTTAVVNQDHEILFILDDFRGKTTLPKGYVAQDVQLQGDGLTLTESGVTPRIGMMESPPLLLHTRERPASDSIHRELPEGHSVDLEIALSRDGQTWSDWNLINRVSGYDYANNPDPANSPGTGESAGAETQDPVKEPRYIKYRLTLTASGEEALLLKTVEVWNRKPERRIATDETGNVEPADLSTEPTVNEDGSEVPHLSGKNKSTGGQP